MKLFRFIPLFRTRPGPTPAGWLDRMFRNRRRPSARVILLGDVLMNFSDWWAAVYHRLPKGKTVAFERDADGRLKTVHYRED